MKQKMVFILGMGGVALALACGFWYFQKSQAIEKTFENQVTSPTEERSGDESVSEDLITEEHSTEEEKAEVKPDLNEGGEKISDTSTQAIEEETHDSQPVDDEDQPKKFSLKQNLVSFGYEEASGRKIDTIVLHSSYNPTGNPYDKEKVIGIWRSYGVAPHYMVTRDGSVYQLVSDKNIAYHAGESTMKDGRADVNKFSLGVEILNTKDDDYTKAQYQAVKDLIAYLKGKHSIKYVVGHDDIAPGRKSDPWNFDWTKIR